jgi:hypothetical protein
MDSDFDDDDSDAESKADSNSEADSDEDSEKSDAEDSDADSADEVAGELVEEETEESLETKLESAKEGIKALRQTIKETKTTKRDSSDKISTLQKQLAKAQKEKNAFCSLKRSEVCTVSPFPRPLSLICLVVLSRRPEGRFPNRPQGPGRGRRRGTRSRELRSHPTAARLRQD